MKISSLDNKFVNFSGSYKTEDVLRLISGYPYKNKATDGELVESLTGVDIYSKEFSSSLPKDATYLFVYLSIITQCQEQILKQHPELKQFDDEFDCKLHLEKGRKAQDAWFKEQLKRYAPQLEIKPFKLNAARLKRTYKDIEKVFNSIF